jgi:hypothetical protein
MRKATAAKRLAVLKGAAVAGVLVTAAFAAGSASAAVTVLNAGINAATNGAALVSAINSANSAGGSNTIVLGTAQGDAAYAPSSEVTVTDPNLTITSNHALQEINGGAPIISGAGTTADAPILAIASGGGLTVEGVDFRGIGVANGTYPAIDDAGTLTSYESAFQGIDAEAAIQIDSTGTATLTESLVGGNLGEGLDNEGGTLTVNNSDITSNYGGIVVNGTTNVNASILSANTGGEGLTNCSSLLNESSYDVDTDDSCAAPGDTTSKVNVTQTLGQTKSNGGPTVTDAISSTASSTNPALGLVASADCNKTDQRFFVYTPTGAGCDAGSYQDNATQDTTPPSCPGPGVIITGPPKQQQITLSDPLSGLGPEGGAISDLSDAQASLTVGNDQADALDGVTITNGSVATPTFSPSGPSNASIVVTATKTNQSTTTMWSFYATNWAGVTKYCD